MLYRAHLINRETSTSLMRTFPISHNAHEPMSQRAHTHHSVPGSCCQWCGDELYCDCVDCALTRDIRGSFACPGSEERLSLL